MYKQIESILKDLIINKESVYGGCIAASKLITTKSGKQYFLKTKAQYSDMFLKEAEGLKELKKADCIRVPKVIFACSDFLLLEFIQKGVPDDDFFANFGRAFAAMHRYSSDRFGFHQDNYIGASVQYNTTDDGSNYTWADFYYHKRILPQYNMLKTRNLADKQLSSLIIKSERVIYDLLKGSEEPPSLMHGDLWSGNFMCDSLGNAVIFDPAVYYGHRELDIAMTKMFGGFSYDFYASYEEEYPLPYGWREREKLYLLYHYLNHLNLFGSSYYGSVIEILKYYV